MATTFQTIRAQQVAVLRALTPLADSRSLFDLAPDDEVLEDWAAREEFIDACYRRFQIRDLHDDEPLLYSDLDTTRVVHSEKISIAYPKLFAKYGADNLLGMDDRIRLDFFQIDRALGVAGAQNYVTSQHLCAHVGGGVEDVGPAVVRSLIYRLEYDRSLS